MQLLEFGKISKKITTLAEKLAIQCELHKNFIIGEERKNANMTFDSEYEPWFQPPSFIIGPIWLVLYSMLALSFILLLSKRQAIAKHNVIILLFIVQLAVNLLWPSVFNSAEYLISLLMIVVMVIFTAIYAYMTYEEAKEVSMLVWPYIAWVSFAGVINLAYLLYA